MKPIDRLKASLSQLSDIPQAEWAYASRFWSERTFERGRHLVRAGEAMNDAYFIIKGLVRYYYLTEEGKAFNKHFATAGDFAASMHSFVLQEPCPFFIQALESTDTIVLPNDRLRQLFERHACWERLGRRIAERLALLKEDREKAFLLDSLQVRYSYFLETYPDLVHRIHQYHIASYLGVTEVALSRIRKKFPA